MRVALDTNVLAYAEGVNGADRRAQALGLIERLPGSSVFLPVQTLGELFQLLVRKLKRAPRQDAGCCYPKTCRKGSRGTE